MLDKMVAIFHDDNGYPFVGYGSNPQECYRDLVAAYDGPFDFDRVSFYTLAEVKVKTETNVIFK